MSTPISKSRTGLVLTVLTVAVLAAAALLWRGSGTADQDAFSPRTPTAAVPAPTVARAEQAVPESPLPTDAASQRTQQAEADAAAARTFGQPLSGPITERPDFVSPIEWQVLKGVASQRADSDKELTRLVNRLRFEKQQELWESMANSGDPAQRRAVAQQLLEEIPTRVSNNELDVPSATKLQLALLDELISDPQQRSLRAAQEAKRLKAPAEGSAHTG